VVVVVGVTPIVAIAMPQGQHAEAVVVVDNYALIAIVAQTITVWIIL
jgi:hypothetical protein